MNYYFLLTTSNILIVFMVSHPVFRSCLVLAVDLNATKKYIDQEPPYLMRQICVPHWEEIKTKNSGATHHFSGKMAQGLDYEYLLFYFPFSLESQMSLILALT